MLVKWPACSGHAQDVFRKQYTRHWHRHLVRRHYYRQHHHVCSSTQINTAMLTQQELPQFAPVPHLPGRARTSRSRGPATLQSRPRRHLPLSRSRSRPPLSLWQSDKPQVQSAQQLQHATTTHSCRDMVLMLRSRCVAIAMVWHSRRLLQLQPLRSRRSLRH